MRLAARIALGVSLASNAAALYLLVPGPAAVIDAPPVALTGTESPPATLSAGGDARDYLDSLLARGLSLDETKPLMLAWLMAGSAYASDNGMADEYWQSGYAAAAVEDLSQRVAVADGARAVLLDVYGPSARRDAVFDSLFAPLDSRYAFLASEQQLALQKLQLERLRAQAQSAPASPMSPAAGSAEPTPARGSATAVALQELQARLGTDAALEYVYRFSPLAEQLRSASLGLSGTEFRDAFRALLELEASNDPQAFARTRETLRTTLGDARFTRLWAARDPYFGAFTAAGRQQGMVDGTVLAAYTIFNDAQDRLAAVVDRYAAVDPQHAGAEVQGIQRDTQQRLVALVGEDAAGALLRAAQRLSVSLQQPSSTNLRE